MKSAQVKQAGSSTRKIRRKPPCLSSLPTIPKTSHMFQVQEASSLCQWCSTPKKPVYMGSGFYCPHYHGGTPCSGHPINLIMEKGGSIFNLKGGGDGA